MLYSELEAMDNLSYGLRAEVESRNILSRTLKGQRSGLNRQHCAAHDGYMRRMMGEGYRLMMGERDNDDATL